MHSESPLLSSSLGHSSPSAQPGVWDLLDHFLQQLRHCPDVSRQLHLTLETVRDSIQADLVYVWSGATEQVIERVGAPDLGKAGYQALADRLLGGAGEESEILVAQVQAGPEWSLPPRSAVLVRLSRRQGAWVVAVRFGEQPFAPHDLKFLTLTRRMLLQHQQQGLAHDHLKEMLFGLVRCLTAALDARDAYTWGHSERVARMGLRLADELGLSEEVRSDLYLGGLLHDVGKIGIDDSVLHKPGKLTSEEMARVQEHVIIGDGIVSHVRQLAHVRPVVRHHHEQYDGQGYPDRLVAEQIPFLARILAVADSCDAMLSERPYRTALSPQRIETIFRGGAGQQWDPRIVDAFFASRHDLFGIGQRGLGDSVVKAVEQVLQASEQLSGTAARTFQAVRPWEDDKMTR
jgi:HD-GYP domain-containing protein (c-di-GMP phosphodiesterase class II)